MAAPTIELDAAEKTGFLSLSESSALFRADVYIAAIARSGSTVLCDLMTFAPAHVCLIEPRFMRGAKAPRLRRQFATAGIHVSNDAWIENNARGRESFLRRYTNFLAPLLRSCTKWGAKEVRPELHEPTIATINPARIVVLVRDARDVAFSLFEKVVGDGGSGDDALAFVQHYLPAACNGLVALTQRDNAVVTRYEDFSRSERELKSLADRLDWPFEGRPNESFASLNRAKEAGRHEGALTAARRYDAGSFRKDVFESLDAVIAKCARYQTAFGYV